MVIMTMRTLRTFCLALALLCPVLGLAAMTAPASASEPEEAPSGDVEEHHYVRLDAISVTLFDEKSVVGLYTVAPTLEIAEEGQRAVVSKNSSRLRDAMIMELHALVARRKTKRIPLDAVKAHLRAVARRMLGDDVVVDLYVENVLRKDS